MNVIEVKGLGKKYRIGKADKQADTLTGALINGLRSPWQNLRNIRNLSRLDRDEDSVAWALRGVSFEVKQGEVLGIIGHNGAGKSTLLKILSRITEPSEGEVRIHGRVAALLEVGTGFHPELTGRENIYMNGTILGMRKKEIDHKLDEIVDFSGVEKYLDTPVKFYSSGMRVRLGFSVAAHLEPEILIIDEVLAVGDAEFQRKCLGKMESVSKSGRTVLFVSHNLDSVKSLCENALLMSSGRVELIGSSGEVVNHYLSEVGARYRWEPSVDQSFADMAATVKLVGIKASTQDSILLSEGFTIDVQIEVLEPSTDLTHLNLFFKAEGQMAFVVSSQPKVLFHRGIHTIQFCFPPALFNNLKYDVDVMVVRAMTNILTVREVLLLDFLDDQPLGWKGKFPGLVRPAIRTNITYHESVSS